MTYILAILMMISAVAFAQQTTYSHYGLTEVPKTNYEIKEDMKCNDLNRWCR